MTTTTTLEQASSFLIVHSSGLEPLHLMTLPIWYELRVDLEDWEGNTASATYSNFYVRSVNYGYSMYYDNFSGGNAGKEVNKQTIKVIIPSTYFLDVTCYTLCVIVYSHCCCYSHAYNFQNTDSTEL